MRKFNFRESRTLNFQFWLNMPLYRIHKFVYDTEQSCWKMPQMPRCLCINTAPFCIRIHPTFQCTHCALGHIQDLMFPPPPSCNPQCHCHLFYLWALSFGFVFWLYKLSGHVSVLPLVSDPSCNPRMTLPLSPFLAQTEG